MVSTPTGPTAVVVGDTAQIAPIHGVPAPCRDLQPDQGGIGRPASTGGSAVDGGKVAHHCATVARRPAASRASAAQSRSPPSRVSSIFSSRAPRLTMSFPVLRRYREDDTQRECRNARATASVMRPVRGGGADQVKAADRYAPSVPRPIADDEVELPFLHRRIEDFPTTGLTVDNLVDEQHVARLQVVRMAASRRHARSRPEVAENRRPARGRRSAPASFCQDPGGP